MNDDIEFGADEESARAYEYNPQIDFSTFVVTKYKRMFILRCAFARLKLLVGGLK